jgi:hypothetical protein
VPAPSAQGLRAYQQRHAALVGPVLPQLGDVTAGQMQALLTGLVGGFMALGRVKVLRGGRTHASRCPVAVGEPRSWLL